MYWAFWKWDWRKVRRPRGRRAGRGVRGRGAPTRFDTKGRCRPQTRVPAMHRIPPGGRAVGGRREPDRRDPSSTTTHGRRASDERRRRRSITDVVRRALRGPPGMWAGRGFRRDSGRGPRPDAGDDPIVGSDIVRIEAHLARRVDAPMTRSAAATRRCSTGATRAASMPPREAATARRDVGAAVLFLTRSRRRACRPKTRPRVRRRTVPRHTAGTPRSDVPSSRGTAADMSGASSRAPDALHGVAATAERVDGDGAGLESSATPRGDRARRCPPEVPGLVRSQDGRRVHIGAMSLEGSHREDRLRGSPCLVRTEPGATCAPESVAFGGDGKCASRVDDDAAPCPRHRRRAAVQDGRMARRPAARRHPRRPAASSTEATAAASDCWFIDSGEVQQ